MINTANLLKLAAFLDNLPPGRFDYSQWASSEELACGTTACALGWASAIPEFGIVLRKEQRGSKYDAIVPCLANDRQPPDREYSYVRVVGQVFGLMARQADLLFIPYDPEFCEMPHRPRFPGDRMPPVNASASEVAAQIRAFVEWR